MSEMNMKGRPSLPATQYVDGSVGFGGPLGGGKLPEDSVTFINIDATVDDLQEWVRANLDPDLYVHPNVNEIRLRIRSEWRWRKSE